MTKTVEEITTSVDPEVDEQEVVLKVSEVKTLFRHVDNLEKALRFATGNYKRHPTEPGRFRYRNWRGKIADRLIIPDHIWFGATEWHPKPQWLVHALDVETGEERDFALKDFLGETPEEKHGGLQLALGGDHFVYGSSEAISLVQDLLLLDSKHPVEAEDVRLSLARKLQDANHRIDGLKKKLGGE